MSLANFEPRFDDQTLCYIEMFASDRISLGQASRELQSLRRIFEGLLIRQGERQSDLPSILRDPVSRRLVHSGPQESQFGRVERAPRPPDVQTADSVWQLVRRDARHAVSEIPVDSIRYGSPFETVLAISQAATVVSGAVTAIAGSAVLIPVVVNKFNNVKVHNAKSKYDAAVWRKKLEALDEGAPVQNDRFVDLPTERAQREIASRLGEDERTVVRALEKVRRFITFDRGRRIDSEDPDTFMDR